MFVYLNIDEKQGYSSLVQSWHFFTSKVDCQWLTEANCFEPP